MEDEPSLGSSSDEQIITFAELADELCPHFMAIGVSYEEYWYGDYSQLEFYRKKHEIEQKQADYKAWLQGAYIYDAICFASPILHAFAKQGTKPTPYHQLPYGETQKKDPELIKQEFLEEWRANKEKWKQIHNTGASMNATNTENGGEP